MPLWSLELFLAALSSFVAVIIGSGGDILFLSSILFLAPMLLNHDLSAFNLGPLVATQGIVATLVGGIAYFRITNLPLRSTFEAIGIVIAGSLSSSIVAYLLPNSTLRLILALAITGGAIQIFLTPKIDKAESIKTSNKVGKRVLLKFFSVAMLTGGLGVGGGFLFYLAMIRIGRPNRELRGLTLILTCTNLVTSFVTHEVTVHVTTGSILMVVAGAAVGSLFAVSSLRKLDERVAKWGLRVLLVSSAIMSWIGLTQYLTFL